MNSQSYTIERDQIKIYSFYDAWHHLKNLGFEIENCIVVYVRILGSGTLQDRRLFFGENRVFSYAFMYNNREIATYMVDMNSMQMQEGMDGKGREHPVPVPSITRDHHLTRLNGKCKNGEIVVNIDELFEKIE